jgi:YesN/AraC family two-component response regulator
MQALLERICALMESRQLFRTQGFKITDLATELGTNRTYVSNCINRLRGESFSDFVNSYRVRYAQILLQMNDSGKTIAQIGAEAGFTGDTSFFRNSKKITGQTPSAWLSDREMS